MRKRLISLWRELKLWWAWKWNVCPNCNSDAPEMDKCCVCEGYWSGKEEYPPSELRKMIWNARMKALVWKES